MRIAVVVGVLLLFIAAVTIFGNHGLRSFYLSTRELARVEQKLTELEAENKRLKQEIDRLTNDLGFIERIAREELGMVKPDELVIQFSDIPRNPSALPQNGETRPAP